MNLEQLARAGRLVQSLEYLKNFKKSITIPYHTVNIRFETNLGTVELIGAESRNRDIHIVILGTAISELNKEIESIEADLKSLGIDVEEQSNGS